jgi:hypothetical protein
MTSVHAQLRKGMVKIDNYSFKKSKWVDKLMRKRERTKEGRHSTTM